MTVASSIVLSLTGSGHLLVYQLGACRILSKSPHLKIHHVAGSSGGAIVATLMAFNFDLDIFANDFFESKGRGLSLLQARLHESIPLTGPSLSICTTHCRTGQLRSFDFTSGNHSESHDPRLMLAVEASCRIPQSFHPVDILSKKISYADSEGILIDGDYYVDGGIAAPAPPKSISENPHDPLRKSRSLRRTLVSPISGTVSSTDIDGDWRISPRSNRSLFSFSLNHNFRVDASFHNLRALGASVGFATASELRWWYGRGQDDAHRFLEETFEA